MFCKWTSMICLPAADVGPIDQHVAIEAARAKQRGIERFRPVRGGHDDDAAVRVEAVHFDEQRVERLLALVVPADVAAAARFAKGVELIDEDDAGRFWLGLLEHIANAGGTHADEHFDEVGTAQAEERHARFAGNGLGEQRFAGSRRADQQHALGNAAAEHLVFFGRLQKLDDFAKLVDRFFDAGDVFERDFDIFLSEHPAAAAAERHRRTGAAHAADHEDEEHDQQAGHQQQRNVIQQRIGRPGDPQVEAFLEQQVGELFLFRQAVNADLNVLLFVANRLVFDFAVGAAGGRGLIAVAE